MHLHFQWPKYGFQIVAKGLLFAFFLLGGVTVKHNSIALGTTSGYAITVSSPPVKEKVARKTHQLQKWIPKIMKRQEGPFSGIGIALVAFILLLVGAIAFGIWAISLLAAAKYLLGTLTGIASLVALSFFIWFLVTFFN